MDFLKKLWPTCFKVKEKDVASLIVQLIIFVLLCFVVGLLIGILSAFPIIGIIFALIGSLMGLYGLVGIVLCFLKFFDVLK